MSVWSAWSVSPRVRSPAPIWIMKLRWILNTANGLLQLSPRSVLSSRSPNFNARMRKLANKSLWICSVLTRDLLLCVVCLAIVFNQLYPKSNPAYSSNPWNVTSCFFTAPENLIATVCGDHVNIGNLNGIKTQCSYLSLLVLLLHSPEKKYLKARKKDKFKNALGLSLKKKNQCVWMEYGMCVPHFLLFFPQVVNLI